MRNITDGCNCGGVDCCAPKPEKKIIEIDFLYLDLTTCQRCQGTDSNLDEAIKEVATVLKYAGIEVQVNKINITTPELAAQYEFLSSPTIRINGEDIALDVTESLCENCGEICGDSVDCRSWVYEGVEYQEPPKEMIVNAVMKAVYGEKTKRDPAKAAYVMPENLKVFFEGIKNKEKN